MATEGHTGDRIYMIYYIGDIEDTGDISPSRTFACPVRTLTKENTEILDSMCKGIPYIPPPILLYNTRIPTVKFLFLLALVCAFLVFRQKR